MVVLKKKLRSANEHYREGGIGQIVQVISAYRVLPAWLIYLYKVDILKLTDRRYKPHNRNSRQSYQYGVADKNDIDQLVGLSGGNERNGVKVLFERYFEHGNKCFVVKKDDQILGYYWGCHGVYTITNDNYQHRQLHVLLKSKQVFFGNGFILPEYRLKGLFPDLVNHAIMSYSPETEFYTSIASLNTSSRNSHIRFGFDVVSNLSCIRLAGTPYCWRSTAPNGKSKLVAWKVATVPISEIVADEA